jgi:hypothetical protein
MHSLNLFQAAMLRWRALHPYNAVHAVRVHQRFDAAAVNAAIAATLRHHRLGVLELDARRQRYAWTDETPALSVSAAASEGDIDVALRDAFERELNARYEMGGRLAPFRFFAIEEGDAFRLGLAYDHFVAGGDTIARLLHDVTAVLAGLAPAPPLDRYGPAYRRLWVTQPGALIGGLPSLATLALACRRSYRVRYRAPQDGHNAVLLARMAPELRERLDAQAQAWRMTTHDLLLALLLKALAPLSAVERARAPRRNEVAVASIVNIRRDLGTGALNALAPCLASFRVAHRVPDEIPVQTLAQDVRARTEAIKRGRRYLQTLVAMGLAGFEWAFMSQAQRQRFFPKHFPVCAGTTPLNVDPLWRDGVGPARPDYVRVVSTGPLAPMVLAFTTSGNAINVGVSYRTTVYTREAVQEVVAAMLRLASTL